MDDGKLLAQRETIQFLQRCPVMTGAAGVLVGVLDVSHDPEDERLLSLGKRIEESKGEQKRQDDSGRA